MPTKVSYGGTARIDPLIAERLIGTDRSTVATGVIWVVAKSSSPTNGGSKSTVVRVPLATA
jgi:membrane-bound lytic murein transglycosylase